MDYTGDNKAYAVNWSNYTNHMRKAFDNLLSANDFVDVTLCCEGKKLGAHKMLLAACSNYFRDIFKEIPCNHPVVILKGVKYEVLVDIIQFIYNGEVSVNTENFNCFLKTAELLEISGLTDNKQVNEINETEVSDSNIATETLTEEKVEKRLAQSPEVIDTPCKKQKNNEETMSIKYEPLDAISDGNVFDPLDDSYVDVNLNSEDLLQATPSQSFKQENTKTEKMDTSSVEEVSDEIEPAASTAKDSFLPTRSKHKYEESYTAYRKWCSKKNIKKSTEDSILAYFNSDLSCYKSSSLWTKYSMLRSTINLQEGVDISKFPSLILFLKRKGEGYKPKKSLTLTKEHIDNFLLQADDKEHLLNKVILILGVAGACRRQELVSLSTTCVEDYQTHFWIKLIDTESKKDRSYIVVPGDIENLNLLDIVRAYIALRPAKTTHNRFFLNYAKEKCTVQPVGINKVGSVPSVVAKFLNLENPSSYTGHCFRRTSAALLGNVGIHVEGMRRHGGWPSCIVQSRT